MVFVDFIELSFAMSVVVPSRRVSEKLQDDLDAVLFEFLAATPQEMIDMLVDKAEALAMSGIVEQAVKEGDIAPHFKLPDADGKMVRINSLIEHGPVIVTVYRGS